ncbi:DNA-binding helix-turn-helix protein [Enterococcus faecalis 13-SD-W-01]|nr:DNA-binding helix-turn-helix protein [Enterococcus faecalis 13-SD-W-01]
MEFNSLIKIIRKKQGLSQNKVAEGIMSQSAYSKFESGVRAVSFEEFNKITEKLKIKATDLNDVDNLENGEISMIRSKLQLALKDELPIYELEQIYELTARKRKKSLQLYRYYLYIQQHFHKHSDKIPQISKKEIDDIFKQLQNLKYWTNYYVQLIMDFSTKFTPKQLCYFVEQLETYQVEIISPIDSNILHLLPGTLSNIADSLIDKAVSPDKIDHAVLSYAKRACIKLQEVLKSRPSIEFELLLKLSNMRHAFFAAQTKKEKETALNNVKQYLQEIQLIAAIKTESNDQLLSITDIIENSLNNVIKRGLPGDDILYSTL